MTERPRKFDGEDRQTEDLAPENLNAEQEDADEQAQTLADEALGRSSDDFLPEDSEKVPTGEEGDDVEDLVDHMEQMASNGRIDNSAYRGEPNLDDNEDKYGPAAKEDGPPGDRT
jgi:hypothetical protein